VKFGEFPPVMSLESVGSTRLKIQQIWWYGVLSYQKSVARFSSLLEAGGNVSGYYTPESATELSEVELHFG